MDNVLPYAIQVLHRRLIALVRANIDRLCSGDTRVPVACRNISTNLEILGTLISLYDYPSSTHGGFSHAC